MRIGDADRYGFTLIARRCDYSVWKTKTGTRYDVCDRKLNYCTVRNGTFGTEAEALACFGQLPDVPSPWLESDKGETQHYDIALLTEEIAQEVVEDFAYESWQSLIKMIPVLAAVEIEHCPYNQDPSGHIEELIEKLKKNHDNGQVTQGYIFVACYARKINNNPAKREFYKMDELKPLNAVKDACQLLRKEGIDYIKIYWTSDHPNDKPGWLCRQSIVLADHMGDTGLRILASPFSIYPIGVR
jgi:hypothetical protein